MSRYFEAAVLCILFTLAAGVAMFGAAALIGVLRGCLSW